MCGLTAILPLHDRRLPASAESLLKPMTRALAHRGPDGEGYWSGAGAALGHRRLAVLDLLTGDQPMATPGGRVQVVFNGQIYNWKELRADLEGVGCEFRTKSDTEVLLHGFLHWGRDLPERLLGMFAFVVHDTLTGETLLARDHLGKKPLYLAEHDGMLLVASEVRSFFAVPGFERRLDPAALREFLALRYVPGTRSLLDGVEQLAPAHVALHRPGEPLSPRRFWAPRFDPTGSSAGAAAALRELVRTSVHDRLEADVPLGAFLSGGVDSSGIVAAMAQESGERVRAVTVGFEETRYDERPHARELAQRFGVELNEELCVPDPEGDLGALVEIFDLPQADSSAWPTWLVCRAARRHVTVALSGDGGDESFAGYRRYRFDLLENRLRSFMPRAPARLLARVAPKGDWLPRPFRFKRTLQNLGADPCEAYFRSVSALLPEEVDELLVGDVAPGVDPFRELRRVYEASQAPDHASRLLDLDLNTYLPGDILVKADRCSMAVSLEVRAPLLDRRVVDFAAALQLSAKLDGSGGKKVLKDSFEPWLGRPWLDRPKQGFSIPLAKWLREGLKEAREAACRGAFAQRFLNGDTLRAWSREHDLGVRDRSDALWAVLVLHRWNERWGHQA